MRLRIARSINVCQWYWQTVHTLWVFYITRYMCASDRQTVHMLWGWFFFASLGPYVPVTLTNCPHAVFFLYAVQSLTHSRTPHSLSQTHAHTHHSFSFSHTHTHTHTLLSLSLTHTHTHTLTQHSLSLPLSLTHIHTHTTATVLTSNSTESCITSKSNFSGSTSNVMCSPL